MMDNEQLPKGYKNTEVGVIPEDWEIVSFETIADKSKKWSITGGPFGSNLKASDYTDDGIQIIQLQNIGDGEFIDDYQIFTSDTKANELISCNIYPGEIILSKMGDPVARACFIPNKAKRFVMASDGIRLVVNERDFSKKFIHDYINSIYFRKRAFEISTGSTRLRIGLPELKSLLVIKPSKSEQTAIATALSDADALINSLEKLIAKKRNIKQGAMQQLLKPKEGWEVKKLGDVGIFKGGNGFPLKIQGKKEGEYPFFKVSDMNNEGNTSFMVNCNNWLSELTKKENSISTFPPNTIVFAKIGAAIFLERKKILVKNSCIDNNMMGFIIDEGKYDFRYIHYLFLTISLGALVSTTALPSLSSKEIGSLEFSFPKKEEQTRISTILSDMDAEIQALVTKLEKYRKIKLGMMQNLLTGKIRLV